MCGTNPSTWERKRAWAYLIGGTDGQAEDGAVPLLTCCSTHTLTLSHTHSHTHTLTHSHTHTPTHSHTHALSLSQAEDGAVPLLTCCMSEEAKSGQLWEPKVPPAYEGS